MVACQLLHDFRELDPVVCSRAPRHEPWDLELRRRAAGPAVPNCMECDRVSGNTGVALHDEEPLSGHATSAKRGTTDALRPTRGRLRCYAKSLAPRRRL